MIKIVALISCLIVITVAANIGSLPGAHPSYRYKYEVKNPQTGDFKGQWEQRDGDRTVGSYMLQEPDGTYRIVNYQSSKGIGFQAHVNRKGHASHPHHGQSYSNIDQLY